jgi:hypothetical protein
MALPAEDRRSDAVRSDRAGALAESALTGTAVQEVSHQTRRSRGCTTSPGSGAQRPLVAVRPRVFPRLLQCTSSTTAGLSCKGAVEGEPWRGIRGGLHESGDHQTAIAGTRDRRPKETVRQCFAASRMVVLRATFSNTRICRGRSASVRLREARGLEGSLRVIS